MYVQDLYLQQEVTRFSLPDPNYNKYIPSHFAASFPCTVFFQVDKSQMTLIRYIVEREY